MIYTNGVPLRDDCMNVVGRPVQESEALRRWMGFFAAEAAPTAGERRSQLSFIHT